MKPKKHRIIKPTNEKGELTTIRNLELVKRFKDAEFKKLSIEDFIKDFLCQFVSAPTKRAYVYDLKAFFDFLKSGDVIITHPNQILAVHFQAYRDWQIEQGFASATINRRLVSIRSFMKWAQINKLIDINPLDLVRLPKVQTESPTLAFDDEEVTRMIALPNTKTHRGRTHRLAMVLLFHLGLRRSELTNAKLGDIREDRGHTVLSVHGKGDKTRLIPLNDFVKEELTLYRDALEKKKVTLNSDDFILQTTLLHKNNGPMDGSTVYRIINRYAKKLNINKVVGAHSCRATVISHLLDTKNRSIRDVATFAGHSNINTTERYDKRRGNLDKSAAYDVGYGEDE